MKKKTLKDFYKTPMASINSYRNVCRICLEQYSILIDWRDEILDFCGVTYKDCYFKYTQLEQLVTDPFPSMLCNDCSTGLKNSHFLIEQAKASYKILQERLSDVAERCADKVKIKSLEDIKVESVEFEMLLFKQSTEKVVSGDVALFSTKKNKNLLKAKRRSFKQLNIQNKELSLERACKDESNSSIDISPTRRTSFGCLSQDSVSESIKSEPKEHCGEDIGENKKNQSKILQKSGKERRYRRSTILAKGKTKKTCKIKFKTEGSNEIPISSTSQEESYDKSLAKKRPGMCSYCSRIIIGTASLRAHEETHKEHRERVETCTVCGLKLFDKKNLSAHMKVHTENREKNHKCEFCDKAFFNRGTLNIHRRVHLGKMIQCPLCSKQYFRQIDLDKHMNSHSAIPINADVKKRSRYYVHCKDCNKSMLSSSWKAHEAVHKNEPLMKCSICSKDFFCRKSCVTHMKKVHHKNTRDDYDKFIESYGKTRLSRLMLEQQEKIKKPRP